jgi:hypothetical protein
MEIATAEQARGTPNGDVEPGTKSDRNWEPWHWIFGRSRFQQLSPLSHGFIKKAWKRQERRVKQYEEVLDTLPGFVVSGLDPTKINQAMALGRRLWLLGPDKVGPRAGPTRRKA